MIRVVGDGGHFAAPIEKVWALIHTHRTELSKIHPEAQIVSFTPCAEDGNITSTLKDVQKNGGKLVRKKEAIRPMGFAAYFSVSKWNVVGLFQPPKGYVRRSSEPESPRRPEGSRGFDPKVRGLENLWRTPEFGGPLRVPRTPRRSGADSDVPVGQEPGLALTEPLSADPRFR
jgi:hypothetical protein